MPILPASFYPEIFSQLLPTVDLLYYDGRPEVLLRPAVTIIGSRQPTSYGLSVTQQLVEKLIQHDIVIISGFALGIDVCAHKAALKGGGRTIAILGSGLDVNYPRAHNYLKSAIVRDGLLLSEYPQGTSPKPQHFPKRNRLLAALANEVIVIECKPRSGSMITVDYAIDLGKPVSAIPGPITSELSAGPNRLIHDGANPIIDLDLFLEDFLRRNHVR